MKYILFKPTKQTKNRDIKAANINQEKKLARKEVLRPKLKPNYTDLFPKYEVDVSIIYDVTMQSHVGAY